MPKLQTHCGICGTEKVPLSSGELVCRPCANRRNAEYKKRHAATVKAKAAKYREKNRDELRRKHAEYRAANPGMDAAYYEANKERIKANVAAYQEANAAAISERRSERWRTDANFRTAGNRRLRNWKKRNPHKVNAENAKRSAHLKQAKLTWANKFFIEEAYDLARRRTESFGFPWEVDHIVPLNSDLVCGLHCEANLQVIPAEHNLAKGNRHWPDMP